MKFKIVLFTLLSLISVSAFSQDVTNGNTATSNATANTTANSVNGGLQNQQNFITNNPGTVQYSGRFTQRNVPTVALGSFSNSFSSDYCSGTMQAGVGIAGAGLSMGKQKLDTGCQLLRSADMTMRIAQVYAADADAAWRFSNTLGPMKSAQAYAVEVRQRSFQKAEKADALKDASVNMICAISDDVRKALVDASIQCPAKH